MQVVYCVESHLSNVKVACSSPIVKGEFFSKKPLEKIARVFIRRNIRYLFLK